MAQTLVKFCGLTRPEDAAEAARLGAAFVGVILAGGARERPLDVARVVLDAAGPAGGKGPKRVGVFGADFVSRLRHAAQALTLDVVQLHADPTAPDIAQARALFGGTVWGAVRVRGDEVPPNAAGVAFAADGVLLDAKVDGGALGGTGAQIQWMAVRRVVAGWNRTGDLVVAGGLNPGNVAAAIAALTPNVVDVSSGVETAPGIKDHAKMAAFMDAVQRSGR